MRRIEVMRLLITLFSKTIYTPANHPITNPWAVEITIKLEKKAVLGMLCSFINTIAIYDPVGWAKLPYNHLLFGDLSEPLVSLCAECLVAILDIKTTKSTLGKTLSALKFDISNEGFGLFR